MTPSHAPAALLLTLCTYGTLSASEIDGNPAAFHGGDRWVAIGDSITHGGWYHAYVYAYYVTRFPQARFSYANCGVSGDTASGTLTRLDHDVLSHQPTVATIMLGMNDVRRDLYGTQGDHTEAQRQAITAYATHLQTMATRLTQAGARLIFITPSIFDQTATFSPEPDPYRAGPDGVGVNTGLSRMAESIRPIADAFHAPVIDLQATMNRLTDEQQRHDPAFTLISKDRVHPGHVGHLVMSYIILKAQHVPADVSTFALDAATGQILSSTHGRIEHLQRTDADLRATFIATSLPYPVAERARPALSLVPWTNDLNRETVQISHLPPGRYQLRIDHNAITTATAEEFSAGIHLAENEQTPQYQQAQQVLRLIEQRTTLISTRLRCLALVEKSYLADVTPIPTDPATLQAIFDKKLAPIQHQSYYGYLRGCCQDYITYKPQEAETLREVQRLDDAIWQQAQPLPHDYHLHRISDR